MIYNYGLSHVKFQPLLAKLSQDWVAAVTGTST